ncbi:MAG: putative bifunctional diguanylate cyclase/phosphodiesterase [Nitriliruptorales bacterium]
MGEHLDLEQAGPAAPARRFSRSVWQRVVFVVAAAAVVALYLASDVSQAVLRTGLAILALGALGALGRLHAVDRRRNLERAREELVRRASLDELTGLPGRSDFARRLDEELGDDGGAAVIVLDMDEFQAVNDTFGHTVGDELLQKVALLLQGCAGADDTVARVGGDEFAVLVREGGEAAALDLAIRLRHELVQPVEIGGRDIYARASVGIAAVGGHEGVTDVLRDADAAMYRAKERGTGAPECFRAAHHGGVLDRLSLATELRRALAHDELVLEYQPIVTVAAGEPVGFEALVRWDHPTRGRISPAEFIPLAERTGLVHDLGAWVLDTASRQCGTWLAEGRNAYVSVNLSGVELRDPSLAERVEETIARSCDPRFIVLEITESSLVGDIETTAQLLGRLKRSGLRLAVDDFGTGYSSLSYLRRLPVDLVKIDRSFVSGITKERAEWTVARAIIELIRGLGMGAVAEGVEDGGQLAHLRALECEYAQGYYFARPGPPEAFS